MSRYVSLRRLSDLTIRTCRHIAPGGWIEQVEISAITRSDDGTIPSGSALERWSGVWSDVSEKLGITFHTAEISFEAIQAAGFTTIHQRIVKIPFGTWPKDRKLKAWGELYQYFLLQGIEGFALRSLTDVLKVTTPFSVLRRYESVLFFSTIMDELVRTWLRGC